MSRPRRKTDPAQEWPEGFAGGPADRRALVVLLHLPSVTPRRLLDLAQTHGTASSCLRALRAGRGGSPADRSLVASLDGGAVERELAAARARLVAVGDPEYPRELLDLSDPPAGLFVRGMELRGSTPRVAIVGARNSSPAGREVAHILARSLAEAGACVVSGGARGIDAAAHQGSLRGGGRTVSVLGSGIDILYPRQNDRLFQEIEAAGAIVSEYPPGTPAEPFRFPARNRIVAGLSRAVVIVEGAEGSGSMITADHALDIGREVFAVPGAVTSPLAWVPLTLIRDGATLIRGPDDLLDELGLRPLVARSPGGVEGEGHGGDRSGPEGAVWTALTGSMPPDAVAGALGLPLPEVVSALVALELRGLVRQVGGRYERRAEPGRA